MNMNQQARQFRRHLLAFMKHQAKATAALNKINAIGLRENKGNPLTSRLQGEDDVRLFATMHHGFDEPFKPGEFSDLIDEAKKALDANGYIV
jgi:hypothetical protein